MHSSQLTRFCYTAFKRHFVLMFESISHKFFDTVHSSFCRSLLVPGVHALIKSCSNGPYLDQQPVSLANFLHCSAVVHQLLDRKYELSFREAIKFYAHSTRPHFHNCWTMRLNFRGKLSNRCGSLIAELKFRPVGLLHDGNSMHYLIKVVF